MIRGRLRGGGKRDGAGEQHLDGGGGVGEGNEFTSEVEDRGR